MVAGGCNEVRTDRPMPPEGKELSRFPRALRGTWGLTFDPSFLDDSATFDMAREGAKMFVQIAKDEIAFLEDSLGGTPEDRGTLDSDTLALKAFRDGWILSTKDSHGWSPMYFSLHENSIGIGLNDLSESKADSICQLLNQELVMDSIGVLGLDAFMYHFQIESNEAFYSSLANEIAPYFIMEKLKQ
ncbi:MAG: hypothetical protein CMC99_00405 [Flavobacteriales bacterium]|nr:hypothetical protein [Flavobacteriales bacterium]